MNLVTCSLTVFLSEAGVLVTVGDVVKVSLQVPLLLIVHQSGLSLL